MEKIGVLIIAYGAREAAIADSLIKSEKYNVNLYIVDKQRNPFNAKIAKKHLVIPDLNIKKACEFAKENKNECIEGLYRAAYKLAEIAAGKLTMQYWLERVGIEKVTDADPDLLVEFIKEANNTIKMIGVSGHVLLEQDLR